MLKSIYFIIINICFAQDASNSALDILSGLGLPNKVNNLASTNTTQINQIQTPQQNTAIVDNTGVPQITSNAGQRLECASRGIFNSLKLFGDPNPKDDGLSNLTNGDCSDGSKAGLANIVPLGSILSGQKNAPQIIKQAEMVTMTNSTNVNNSTDNGPITIKDISVKPEFPSEKFDGFIFKNFPNQPNSQFDNQTLFGNKSSTTSSRTLRIIKTTIIRRPFIK